MPRRSRYRKNSNQPRAYKHSGTIIASIGQGSNVTRLDVMLTSGGQRSTDGASKTIQSSANTEEICRVSDEVKTVNLTIQACARVNVGEAARQNRIGWMEWAFICVREDEKDVPSTNLGVQTLGDICTNMYRGECIYTGAIPLGDIQPIVQPIILKIPKSKRKMKLGDAWRFLTFFRASSSTATGTTEIRLVKSFAYLCHPA